MYKANIRNISISNQLKFKMIITYKMLNFNLLTILQKTKYYENQNDMGKFSH